ncbi:Aste57867_1740 [Aphanomyces stellatus]|uniref:Aste57867_1740 protein n=1 Tax=Aphanomyces stellatus TaxID=120398 RepID=A0A485K749_9STRA|nr:hypothetical protein As57867_001738 [Aphanomyces stellatus]VFT78950.1 Aste57867_1740 [Aphanomyces stellatus]
MFLAAVSRPRFDINMKCIFDGKIGVWPFVEQSSAARSSKNRPKGTMLTTTVSVDSEVYTNMIVDHVIPAIKSKMPRCTQRRGVIIQQDNATPHRCVSTEMLKASRIHGVKVSNQPPNSPDFNVLDLGFFNSIQSLQHQKMTQTVEDLIGAVENAFHEMPADTLARTFVSLQSAMVKSIELHGMRDYKLSHLKKTGSVVGLSKTSLECPIAMYTDAINNLNSLD